MAEQSANNPWTIMKNVALFYGAVLTSTLLVSSFLSSHSSTSLIPLSSHAPLIGVFLLLYWLVMQISRVHAIGWHLLYEAAWCCNSGMLLAAIGCLTNRPLLIGGSVAAVLVDQLMWYIDIAAFLTIRKFPVGVAKYLAWPQTTMSKRLTATHHLWFVPLMLAVLRWHMPSYSWLVSVWFASFSSVLGRAMPYTIKVDGMEKSYYLNLNAGHAFWKDVHFRFLHIFDDAPGYVYLPYLMFIGNVVLNLPPYLLLCAIF